MHRKAYPALSSVLLGIALCCLLTFFVGAVARADESIPRWPDETIVLRVDVEGTASAPDGSSWALAYPDLQDALAAVQPGVGSEVQIWVAEGVYYPDRGTDQVLGDRSATFQLRDRVLLYGGFQGDEETLGERRWRTHITVLSGDIDGNDTVNTQGVVTTSLHITGNNSLHVVTGSGATAEAQLNGFILTGGQANGEIEGICGPACGGALLLEEGSPTLLNMIVVGNQALLGGGMASVNGGALLEQVIFAGNGAGEGGALRCRRIY